MPISATQKNKILRVVNVFETGTPDGEYANVTRLKDGPNGIRQITYGRSQTTEFGNLKRLLELYVQRNGQFASAFAPYLRNLGKLPSLESDAVFIRLLKDAGNTDPVMRSCQDEFFDLYYYQPAFNWFSGFGFTEALSLLVIYDSFIHSGSIPGAVRQRFAERPPKAGGNERVWITQYVNARHDWLATHSKVVLHATVYRTRCFKNQITAGNWDLSQVVIANGTRVS